VDPHAIDITPSVADVAALLRARTKDMNGDEVGTFNDDTRPTSAQVITLIEEAVGDIEARMRVSPPPELAAPPPRCLVELSCFPEQAAGLRGIGLHRPATRMPAT
jgi:hypothetical protein